MYTKQDKLILEAYDRSINEAIDPNLSIKDYLGKITKSISMLKGFKQTSQTIMSFINIGNLVNKGVNAFDGVDVEAPEGSGGGEIDTQKNANNIMGLSDNNDKLVDGYADAIDNGNTPSKEQLIAVVKQKLVTDHDIQPDQLDNIKFNSEGGVPTQATVDGKTIDLTTDLESDEISRVNSARDMKRSMGNETPENLKGSGAESGSEGGNDADSPDGGSSGGGNMPDDPTGTAKKLGLTSAKDNPVNGHYDMDTQKSFLKTKLSGYKNISLNQKNLLSELGEDYDPESIDKIVASGDQDKIKSLMNLAKGISDKDYDFYSHATTDDIYNQIIKADPNIDTELAKKGADKFIKSLKFYSSGDQDAMQRFVIKNFQDDVLKSTHYGVAKDLSSRIKNSLSK